MDRIQKEVLKLLESKIVDLTLYESLLECIRSSFGWESKTNLEVVMGFRNMMESGRIRVSLEEQSSHRES